MKAFFYVKLYGKIVMMELTNFDKLNVKMVINELLKINK